MTLIHFHPENSLIHIQFTTQSNPNFIDELFCYIEQLSVKGGYSVSVDLKGLNITYLSKNKAWIEEIIKFKNVDGYTDKLVEIKFFNTPFIAKQVYSLLTRHIRGINEKIVFVPKKTALTVN